MALHLEVPKPHADAEAALNIFPLSHTNSVNCLAAMRAQSPPRDLTKKLAADILAKNRDEEDEAYASWLADHPSAISNFEILEDLASGKELAVFLDYDGTLSPIVEDPSKAFMTDEMRDAVRKVATHFPTAIISGRAREKVFSFVKLDELFYAGSHGMDIRGPDNFASQGVAATASQEEKTQGSLSLQPAAEYYPILTEVFDRLKEASSPIEGALVENNKFCISVHFRRVDDKDWEALAHTTMEVLLHYPKLRTTHGRKVLEIRPDIDWDKGKALAYLLENLGLDDRSKVFPLYIGDDRTDEDAFKVLREKAVGCGIVVTTKPRPTGALLSLRDPREVMAFLKRIVEWNESRPK